MKCTHEAEQLFLSLLSLSPLARCLTAGPAADEELGGRVGPVHYLQLLSERWPRNQQLYPCLTIHLQLIATVTIVIIIIITINKEEEEEEEDERHIVIIQLKAIW